MVKNVNIELTKFQVEQLEYFADLLEGFDYSIEDAEIKFLILIVNIESLLPSSNIFDYVAKTDKYKDEKLQLQLEREELYLKIKSQYERIEVIDNKIAEMETDIEDSEWRVDPDSNEEMTFNKVKEKLVIEKRINYGNI